MLRSAVALGREAKLTPEADVESRAFAVIWYRDVNLVSAAGVEAGDTCRRMEGRLGSCTSA
jgi:hypothetical protein